MFLTSTNKSLTEWIHIFNFKSWKVLLMSDGDDISQLHREKRILTTINKECNVENEKQIINCQNIYLFVMLYLVEHSLKLSLFILLFKRMLN